MKAKLALMFLVVSTHAAFGFQSDLESIGTLYAGLNVSPAILRQDPNAAKVASPAEPIGGLAAIQKKVNYPEIAKRAGIEGTVYVEATVDVNGNVSSTKVTKGVHTALDKEAAEAVAKTKFAPASAGGKAVPSMITVPIRFRLDSKNKAQKHMLFQGNYEMGAGGGIAVPERAEWKAREIEGRRVLLVLQEKWGEQNGFWSVMSYLTKDEAKKLSEELKKAAENIK